MCYEKRNALYTAKTNMKSELLLYLLELRYQYEDLILYSCSDFEHF